MKEPNQRVQRTGASRSAQRQSQRHQRLTPVADLVFGKKMNIPVQVIFQEIDAFGPNCEVPVVVAIDGGAVPGKRQLLKN